MMADFGQMNQRLLRLAESPNSRFWRVNYEALSRAEQIFLMIWELEAEVNNGGFHQYFSNSSGFTLLMRLTRYVQSAQQRWLLPSNTLLIVLAMSSGGTITGGRQPWRL